MITTKDIRAVFKTIPPGTTLTVSELQSLVQNTYQVTAEDQEPYVNTRKTFYPKWHHRIQQVLYSLKENGEIIHNSGDESYTF